MGGLVLLIHLATFWIFAIGEGTDTILETPLTRDSRHCAERNGIFPDPSDCRTFYLCSHGVGYRKKCPKHTGFDENYYVCVHAYDVECGGRGGIYGTLAPPFFKHVVKDAEKVTEPPSAIDFHCLQEYGRVPDLDNCKGFYECNRGHALWKKCPNNNAFDEKLAVCVHLSFVECHGRGGVYGTLVPLGTDFKKTSMTKDKQCPRKFGIFPDPDDCRAFYECSYGTAKRKECPKLTAFDERLSVCGHEVEVNCGARGSISGPLPALPNIDYPN